MHRGYVKLWRKFDDWPYRKNPNYVSVWIALILNASHKSYPIDWCGTRITLEPGQMVTSVRAIEEESGVHRASAQRILKRLENETQIEQQITAKSRLITIVNWHEYQCSETESETLVRHWRDTDETLVRHNKNVKNVKNVKKTPTTTVDGQWILQQWVKAAGKLPNAIQQEALLEIHNAGFDQGRIEEAFVQMGMAGAAHPNYLKKALGMIDQEDHWDRMKAELEGGEL